MLAITSVPFASLTAEQADVPPDADMAEYRDGLRSIYPTIDDDATVEVVRFRVTAPPLSRARNNG